MRLLCRIGTSERLSAPPGDPDLRVPLQDRARHFGDGLVGGGAGAVHGVGGDARRQAVPSTTSRARLGARTDGITWPMTTVSTQAGSASDALQQLAHADAREVHRGEVAVDRGGLGEGGAAARDYRHARAVGGHAVSLSPNARALTRLRCRALHLGRDDGPRRFGPFLRVLLSRQGPRCGRTELATQAARIRTQGPSRLSKGLLLFQAPSGRGGAPRIDARTDWSFGGRPCGGRPLFCARWLRIRGLRPGPRGYFATAASASSYSRTCDARVAGVRPCSARLVHGGHEIAQRLDLRHERRARRGTARADRRARTRPRTRAPSRPRPARRSRRPRAPARGCRTSPPLRRERALPRARAAALSILTVASMRPCVSAVRPSSAPRRRTRGDGADEDRAANGGAGSRDGAPADPRGPRSTAARRGRRQARTWRTTPLRPSYLIRDRRTERERPQSGGNRALTWAAALPLTGRSMRRAAALLLLLPLAACGGGGGGDHTPFGLGLARRRRLRRRDRGGRGQRAPGDSVTVERAGYIRRDTIVPRDNVISLWPSTVNEAYVRTLVYSETALRNRLVRWPGTTITVPRDLPAEIAELVRPWVTLVPSDTPAVTIVVDPADPASRRSRRTSSAFTLSQIADSDAHILSSRSSSSRRRTCAGPAPWPTSSATPSASATASAPQDLMFPSTARTTTVFSADERVLLTMMYTHRRPGQVAPDNDQALGQGATGIVRVIAQ